MSYLSQPTSNLNYGVVEIGSNIQVQDGIISLLQDIAPNASVHFGNVSVTSGMLLNGNSVITSINPYASVGISLSNVTTLGPTATFTVTNTGVTKLSAGTGINLSGATGNITISGTGTSVINVIGVTLDYTAAATDEYIGVDSTSAININLPIGSAGRTYIIKDEHGQGSGKINIKPAAGELIDGSATYIISVPYQSVQVVFRSGQWRII